MHRETVLGISGVCRNLFGPVDHDQLSRDLKAKLKEIAEQDARRWNFNFETDMPLPGRYQWEETPLHSSPAFYQESTQDEDICVSLNTEDSNTLNRCCESPLYNNEETLPVPCHVEINQENCSNVTNTHKLSNEATPVRLKRAFSERVASHKTNAQITGMFKNETNLFICNSWATPMLIGYTIRKVNGILIKSIPSLCFSADFFAKKRRTSETKTSLNSFFTSSSEQNLRKRIR